MEKYLIKSFQYIDKLFKFKSSNYFYIGILILLLMVIFSEELNLIGFIILSLIHSYLITLSIFLNNEEM